MEIVVVLVPLMLMLVTGGIILFNWAVKNGQYDDLEGPAHRILYDDDKDRIPADAITGLEKTRRSASDAQDEPETDTDTDADAGTSKADEAANNRGNSST
ncbi:cbb3-type cytochrome oxidase assembly protein CcoS [Marinobacter gelidimuriae]|uniref:cbb3-type cytochrome oxidase assembly protein CcoS n=1 Tax=Marinobacter gelidimuriae TaxID=2739064 RepID=UPI0003819115|nr:cbb3-type cytochrome oxidase assembly protein CcoS [Marinobacter gelidimuriae]